MKCTKSNFAHALLRLFSYNGAWILRILYWNCTRSFYSNIDLNPLVKLNNVLLPKAADIHSEKEKKYVYGILPISRETVSRLALNSKSIENRIYFGEAYIRHGCMTTGHNVYVWLVILVCNHPLQLIYCQWELDTIGILYLYIKTLFESNT